MMISLEYLSGVDHHVCQYARDATYTAIEDKIDSNAIDRTLKQIITSAAGRITRLVKFNLIDDFYDP